MLLKHFDLPAEDEYGQHVRVLHPNPVDMQKVAADDELSDELKKFAETVTAQDGKLYLIINALGAGEYYGSNNNGDYFPEAGLKQHCHTFYNAYPYKHHVNKDPKRAYGRIIFVHYNPRMHRVELVTEIDREKNPEMAEKVDKGEFPETSMGCKCPYDICSVCGHKAAKVSDYCTHLRGQMNQVLPGGKKVFAITPVPNFFDISEVFRGADRTSRVLKKVAHEGAEPSAVAGEQFYGDHLEATDKGASEVSMTDNEKVAHDAVMGMLDDFAEHYLPILEANEPTIETSVLNKLANDYSCEEIISTTANMGIVLKPEEYQRIILVKSGQEHIADHLDKQGIRISTDAEWDKAVPEPHLVDEKYHNVKIAEEMAKYMPERSALDTHLTHRVVRMCKHASLRKHANSAPVTPIGEDRSMLPLLAFLGLGYIAYRKVVPMSQMGRFDKFLAENPKFAIPVLGATAAGIMGLGEVANPSTPQNYIRKEAALGIPFPALTVPVGLSYIYGQHVRGEAQRGKPVGHISALMAQHPFATGLLGSAAFGAMRMRGMKKALNRVSKNSVSPSIAKLTKGAEERLLQPQELGKLAGVVGDSLAEYLAFRSLPGAVLDTLLFRAIDKAATPKVKVPS
jgi:5-hydroxyisourate hydrolase-like protein (transthyretin family)